MRIPIITAAVPLLVCACSGDGEASTTTETATRIVTTNGTLTEIVAALGLEDRLVGVDITSTYPVSVQHLPRIGHDRTIRTEGVLSLSPDLVLGGTWQLDATTQAQLQQAGGRMKLYPQEFSVQGTKDLIRQVAAELHATDTVEALLSRIDDDLRTVRPLPVPPKVLFIYARGAGAMMVAGTGTPMQHLIELAGGTNAVNDFEQFKPLTPEALIAADPDAILLFDSGLDALQGEQGLLQVPGVSSTKAGRNKAFITMDGGLLSNFGPRVGQAIAQLNAALHGLATKG
jgi:iron complex transport system substrate-binding protein